MKYIILNPRGAGLPLFLFTLAPLSHAALAAPYEATHTVRSAGFCDFQGTTDPARPVVRVYGESSTLQIHSHPDDARIISAMMQATLESVLV